MVTSANGNGRAESAAKGGYAGAPAAKRNRLGTAALIAGILAVFPGTLTALGGWPWDPKFEWKFVNNIPTLVSRVGAWPVVTLVFVTAILGVVLGAWAVVLGFIARGRVTRGEADNSGTALGGILLGGLAILVSVAFIVMGLTVFKNAGFSEYFDCVTNASGDQAQTDQCTSEFKQRVQNLQTTAPGR